MITAIGCLQIHKNVFHSYLEYYNQKLTHFSVQYYRSKLVIAITKCH